LEETDLAYMFFEFFRVLDLLFLGLLLQEAIEAWDDVPIDL
jgi:hypothetical protein